MLKLVCVAACALGAAAFPVLRDTAVAPAPQDPQDPQRGPDMAAMMARMARYTQPGPHHAALQRFVGTWITEMRITMAGSETPAEKGESTFSWLMDGRWLQARGTGSMMGQPVESFVLLGYDNFKQSYVSTGVTSMDTAMLRTEGDMTRDGDALISYGTMDEYLTGEHDKMVKLVWRFVSDDEMVQEVHDLPIGESGTKVVEIRYRRKR